MSVEAPSSVPGEMTDQEAMKIPDDLSKLAATNQSEAPEPNLQERPEIPLTTVEVLARAVVPTAIENMTPAKTGRTTHDGKGGTSFDKDNG